MLNNDVLRSLRYLLNVNDSKLEALCRLADYPVEPGLISACLLREDEAFEHRVNPNREEEQAHPLPERERWRQRQREQGG